MYIYIYIYIYICIYNKHNSIFDIPRPQLVSMCEYMGLPQYGADAFLRFQLRTKLRNIKEDDRRILWEGIDVLTSQELREACQERGVYMYIYVYIYIHM
jgi:LETM1 and EF-hand domain-containing protein 1